MHNPVPYYEVRTREFQGRLESGPSETLEALLRTALSHTNATAVRFTELAELANRVKPLVKQLWEQTANDIGYNLENSRDLTARLNKILEDPKIDPELKTSTALTTYQAMLSAKTAANASVVAADIFVQGFQTSITLLVDTLALKLLRPDYTEFAANAVHEGIMAAIDLIPVLGPVAGAIKKLWDVLTFPDAQFRAANDYTIYLENYIRAAELWSGAAAEIIGLYNGWLTTSRKP